MTAPRSATPPPPGTPPPGTPGVPSPATRSTATPDPLRLCIFATVALLGWLAGPFALAGFAAPAFAAYWRARRAGLTRSRCLLGDTRVVLTYLGLLVLAATVGIGTRLDGTW